MWSVDILGDKATDSWKFRKHAKRLSLDDLTPALFSGSGWLWQQIPNFLKKSTIYSISMRLWVRLEDHWDCTLVFHFCDVFLNVELIYGHVAKFHWDKSWIHHSRVVVCIMSKQSDSIWTYVTWLKCFQQSINIFVGVTLLTKVFEQVVEISPCLSVVDIGSTFRKEFILWVRKKIADINSLWNAALSMPFWF